MRPHLLQPHRTRRRRRPLRGDSIPAKPKTEEEDEGALREDLPGCEVFYTRAFASYEKGSVENCNRIVGRWYPKGTNLSACPHADIIRLENTINDIHRLSLGGLTASEYARQVKAIAA